MKLKSILNIADDSGLVAIYNSNEDIICEGSVEGIKIHVGRLSKNIRKEFMNSEVIKIKGGIYSSGIPVIEIYIDN